MRRKKFLGLLGKGAALSLLLPDLAFTFAQRKSFFVLITGGGIPSNDLTEKVFPAALKNCENKNYKVQELFFQGKNLSHYDALHALCGLSPMHGNYSKNEALRLFHTSSYLNTQNSFLTDEESFNAALQYKIRNPESSVICYLNGADAAHYSIISYREALENYQLFAQKLTAVLQGHKGEIIIGSELGRDFKPGTPESGWHHVCEESRKTKCLWISGSTEIPPLKIHEEIQQCLSLALT